MTLLRPRRRKLLASLAVGCWMFAFFVGAVHSCEQLRQQAGSHHAAMAMMDHHQHDDAVPPCCEQPSAGDLAVPVKVKSVSFEPDQPGPQLLVPVTGVPEPGRSAPLAPWFDPPAIPPDIPLYTRFLRLAL